MPSKAMNLPFVKALAKEIKEFPSQKVAKLCQKDCRVCRCKYNEKRKVIREKYTAIEDGYFGLQFNKLPVMPVDCAEANHFMVVSLAEFIFGKMVAAGANFQPTKEFQKACHRHLSQEFYFFTCSTRSKDVYREAFRQAKLRKVEQQTAALEVRTGVLEDKVAKVDALAKETRDQVDHLGVRIDDNMKRIGDVEDATDNLNDRTMALEDGMEEQGQQLASVIEENSKMKQEMGVLKLQLAAAAGIPEIAFGAQPTCGSTAAFGAQPTFGATAAFGAQPTFGATAVVENPAATAGFGQPPIDNASSSFGGLPPQAPEAASQAIDRATVGFGQPPIDGSPPQASDTGSKDNDQASHFDPLTDSILNDSWSFGNSEANTFDGIEVIVEPIVEPDVSQVSKYWKDSDINNIRSDVFKDDDDVRKWDLERCQELLKVAQEGGYLENESANKEMKAANSRGELNLSFGENSLVCFDREMGFRARVYWNFYFESLYPHDKRFKEPWKSDLGKQSKSNA